MQRFRILGLRKVCFYVINYLLARTQQFLKKTHRILQRSDWNIFELKYSLRQNGKILPSDLLDFICLNENKTIPTEIPQEAQHTFNYKPFSISQRPASFNLKPINGNSNLSLPEQAISPIEISQKKSHDNKSSCTVKLNNSLLPPNSDSVKVHVYQVKTPPKGLDHTYNDTFKKSDSKRITEWKSVEESFEGNVNFVESQNSPLFNSITTANKASLYGSEKKYDLIARSRNLRTGSDTKYHPSVNPNINTEQLVDNSKLKKPDPSIDNVIVRHWNIPKIEELSMPEPNNSQETMVSSGVKKNHHVRKTEVFKPERNQHLSTIAFKEQKRTAHKVELENPLHSVNKLAKIVNPLTVEAHSLVSKNTSQTSPLRFFSPKYSTINQSHYSNTSYKNYYPNQSQYSQLSLYQV